MQWFLNLLEVLILASFMQAFTEPFLKIQKISVYELESKVSYLFVAYEIISFKEIKPTKHELCTKMQLNKYFLLINVSYAVAFWKQF